MKQRRTTLALGGGGARGLAHLGAIEELLAAGYEVERIVGVSVGSLVGAQFAFDSNIARVQQRTCEYLRSDSFAKHQRILLGAHPAPAERNGGRVLSGYHRFAKYVRANRMLYRAVSSGSLLPGVLLEAVVNHLLPDADIADAAIPLSIVAVDLNTGQPVVFERGPLRLAAMASAAVPGIFPPVAFEDRLLCDIGGFYSLPIGIARKYDPDFLVAVDVGSNLRPLSQAATALDVMMRMNDIGAAMFRKQLDAAADLTVIPDLGNLFWFDFTTADAVIESGSAAARKALATLQPPRNVIQRMFANAFPSRVHRNGHARRLL